MKKYIARSPEETMEIGYRLGQGLRSGDVVGLYGELGTGKTVFVKGVARALGIGEREITSASFTIITQYPTRPPFTHIDLYRVERNEELDEIGIHDQLGGEGVTVIEWAERAEDLLPEGSISVYLRCTGTHIREITIEGINEENRDNIQDKPS